MAQLVLMGAKMLCGFPAARIVGPFIAPLIPVSPLNIICYLAWLLGLKFTKAAWAKKLAPTWKKAALWALLFYFCTLVPIYFLILFLACKAAG